MGPKMDVTSCNETDKTRTPPLESATVVAWHGGPLVSSLCVPSRHSSPKTPYVVIVYGAVLHILPICS